MKRPFASSLLSATLVSLAFLQAVAGLAAPMAAGKSKFVGCAYSSPQAPNFATYFNQVTPENAGKWGSVEATRGVMNWTELDTAYNFAKSNGLKFRHHILVWGSQQPDWISALSTAEKRAEIEQWFAAVAAHYPDLDYVEVVNEPLHAPPNGATIAFSTTAAANYADALGGTGASGWEWILQSFRLARQYFPGKKLVLNEYGLLNDANAMARYVQIINLLKAESLVDVVSVQAHSFETKDFPTATLAANLATLTATGLPVMITEMDIDDTVAAPQLADYQRIFPLFWENPSVVGITLWGYRPGLWRSAANLVQADGTEKPAMVWLKSYVANNLPVVTGSQSFNVPSGASNQTLLGIVQATDADAGTTLRDWSIVGGTAANAVAIDATTGGLRITDVAALNFSTQASYTVSVKVGDGIGHSVPVSITLTAAPAPVLVNDLAAYYTTFAGGPFLLNVYAYGSPIYEWQYSADGVNFTVINSANNPSRAAFFSFDSPTAANSGYYRVRVMNESGGATVGRISRINFVPVAAPAVRPDGYAAATTGGGTADVAKISVSTAADLRAAAIAAEPRIITVTGTLDIGTLEVASNKTIQGANVDAALLGTLRIGAGVSNVVIRQLNLSSPAGDALVVAGGSKVFVTRCTFLDAAGHQLAITDGADLVTVSWCEFTFASKTAANRRSVLVGRAGAETKALHVTMHHNFWHGPIGSDVPLATYAHLHLYNNIISSEGNVGGTVADSQTQLLNERNDYSYMQDPLIKRQGGLIRTLAADYSHCTGVAPDGGTDSVFVPTYGYSLLPASEMWILNRTYGNRGYVEAAGPSASIAGPASDVVPAAALTLTASVTNGIAKAYQWRRGGAPIAGATASTYSATMSAAEAGLYTVEATMINGELAVSAPFTVTLGTTPPPPPPPPSSGGSGGSSGGGGGGAMPVWFAIALGALALVRRQARRR